MKSLYHCLLLLSFCLSFKRMISNDHFAGIVLILAGQCVSAIQMIVEESFLKKKNFHPLQVSSLLDKKGSPWFTLGVLQFVTWFSSKPYRDA